MSSFALILSDLIENASSLTQETDVQVENDKIVRTMEMFSQIAALWSGRKMSELAVGLVGTLTQYQLNLALSHNLKTIPSNLVFKTVAAPVAKATIKKEAPIVALKEEKPKVFLSSVPENKVITPLIKEQLPKVNVPEVKRERVMEVAIDYSKADLCDISNGLMFYSYVLLNFAGNSSINFGGYSDEGVQKPLRCNYLLENDGKAVKASSSDKSLVSNLLTNVRMIYPVLAHDIDNAEGFALFFNLIRNSIGFVFISDSGAINFKARSAINLKEFIMICSLILKMSDFAMEDLNEVAGALVWHLGYDIGNVDGSDPAYLDLVKFGLPKIVLEFNQTVNMTDSPIQIDFFSIFNYVQIYVQNNYRAMNQKDIEFANSNYDAKIPVQKVDDKRVTSTSTKRMDASLVSSLASSPQSIPSNIPIPAKTFRKQHVSKVSHTPQSQTSQVYSQPQLASPVYSQPQLEQSSVEPSVTAFIQSAMASSQLPPSTAVDQSLAVFFAAPN